MAHEDLKKQYEADALWHPRPWELWETNYINNRWGGLIFSDQAEWFFDNHPENIRRKPNAPSKNCAMCKHRKYLNCAKVWMENTECICPACLNGKPYPNWCPLDKPEEDKNTELIKAAEEVLDLLDGFEVFRGHDKVMSLWGAVEKAKKEKSN